jgi:hypothetical protein
MALVKSLVQRLNDRPSGGRVNARLRRRQEANKVQWLLQNAVRRREMQGKKLFLDLKVRSNRRVSCY